MLQTTLHKNPNPVNSLSNNHFRFSLKSNYGLNTWYQQSNIVARLPSRSLRDHLQAVECIANFSLYFMIITMIVWKNFKVTQYGHNTWLNIEILSADHYRRPVTQLGKSFGLVYGQPVLDWWNQYLKHD